MEATPLLVGDVMYVSGIWGLVYALDAKTGHLLWSFNPHSDTQFARYGGTDVPTRGLAVVDGKVYAIATDCRLYALDARTGRVIWAVQTLEHAEPGYACSGAPQVAGKLVVIGNVGGDNLKGGIRGYVSAFFLDTGRLAWRFFTVPSLQSPDPAAEWVTAAATWDPHRDPSFGGGGTVWGLVSYDPALGLLYFGTGNAAPYDARRDWSGGTSTDRLYAASIIALDASTGRMRWYYQATPGDSWDFDADANLVLAEFKIDGRLRGVLMQANKNGYFYVIDRETGQPLRAHPFSYINWSKGMDSNFRPIVDRAVDYGSGPKVVYPSMAGAHSWPPMSYSPDTGLVYVPTIEAANMLVDLAKTPSARVRGYDGAFDVVYIFRDQDFTQDYWESLLGPLPSFPSTEPAASASRRPPIRSVLKALDPITGQVAWQQVTSQDHLLLDGGVLSTAGGLVFAGREDGKFIAYDAKTGRVLKKLETGSAIMAAPMSYEIDGHQYVAVLCGHGGTAWAYAGTAAMEHLNEDRVLVFSLDGAPEVPKPERRKEERYRQPPPREGGPDQNSRLNDGIGSLSTFKAIVRQGAFLPLGMPRFDDVITDQDAEAIHANLVDQSWQQFLRQGQSKR